jgi:hypothetical protein
MTFTLLLPFSGVLNHAKSCKNAEKKMPKDTKVTKAATADAHFPD